MFMHSIPFQNTLRLLWNGFLLDKLKPCCLELVMYVSSLGIMNHSKLLISFLVIYNLQTCIH